MDQRIIDLYDEFTHAHLDRRLFMQRLTALVGSTAAALALLPQLESNHAIAQTVPENDPRLKTEDVSYPGSRGPVRGYVARPAAGAKGPGVLVIHENRGLQPHIRDVARRAALAGYVALAPDLLSAIGGTPASEDGARTKFAQVEVPVAFADALKSIESQVLEKCDALDGVKDGVIDDPRRCTVDPASLTGLTDAQRHAVKAIYSETRGKGDSIYPAQPVGGEGQPGGWPAWIVGMQPGPTPQGPSLRYAFGTQFFKYFVFSDPDWDYTRYDISTVRTDARIAGRRIRIDPSRRDGRAKE